MHDPLISRSLLADLRLAHGIFNLLVLLLFIEQARLGIKIRRARKASLPSPFPAISYDPHAGVDETSWMLYLAGPLAAFR